MHRFSALLPTEKRRCTKVWCLNARIRSNDGKYNIPEITEGIFEDKWIKSRFSSFFAFFHSVALQFFSEARIISPLTLI